MLNRIKYNQTISFLRTIGRGAERLKSKTQTGANPSAVSAQGLRLPVMEYARLCICLVAEKLYTVLFLRFRLNLVIGHVPVAYAFKIKCSVKKLFTSTVQVLSVSTEIRAVPNGFGHFNCRWRQVVLPQIVEQR
jgi:hypothetical protein